MTATELIARAVQVMREHENDYNYGGPDERCSGCGAVVDDFDRHHAEALAAAGLLVGSEWQWGVRINGEQVMPVRDEAESRAILARDSVRRPVGPWVDVADGKARKGACRCG